MTDKKIFGKLAGSAFQAVGTAASAVGEKFAKSDADESSAEKSETPELESDDLTDEDRAFLEALGLEADCRDEKSGKFHWLGKDRRNFQVASKSRAGRARAQSSRASARGASLGGAGRFVLPNVYDEEEASRFL